MMQAEEWKPVVGFEDRFLVSNLGRVANVHGKVLKQSKSKTGYWQLSTRIGGRSGKAVCFKVHRLVAEAFLDAPSAYLEQSVKDTHYGVVLVNHIDGNKTNNNACNLEWTDYGGNRLHAKLAGLIPRNKRGLDSPVFKLTEQDVEYVHKNYKPRCKECGARALARKLNVHHKTILRVLETV